MSCAPARSAPFPWRRAAGVGFLLCCAALAASLAASGFGAMAADAVLQSLGLAPLIPPLVLTAARLAGACSRSSPANVAMAVAAAIALAGAGSALPGDGSLLRHGFGGMFGEALLDLASSALAPFGWCAPFGLLAAGGVMMAQAMGLRRIGRAGPRRRLPADRVEPGFDLPQRPGADDAGLAIARRFAPSVASRPPAVRERPPRADRKPEPGEGVPEAGRPHDGREPLRDAESAAAPPRMRDMLRSAAFCSPDVILPLAVGVSDSGKPVVPDLARVGHVLFAGAHEAEIAGGLNGAVLSLLARQSPATCRLLMIDAGGAGLAAYDGVPHLLAPVVRSDREAASALAWAASEIERRQTRMAKLAVSSTGAFNQLARASASRGETLFRLVHTGFDGATGEATIVREPIESAAMTPIVILVHGLDHAGPETKHMHGAVRRIARSGAATGVHLVMTARPPFGGALTRAIGEGYPARACYRVSSRVDSRMAIGAYGAEQLRGEGDLLFSSREGEALRLRQLSATVAEILALTRELGAWDGPPRGHASASGAEGWSGVRAPGGASASRAA